MMCLLADAASDAAVLHARALLAEDDGNAAEALALLRQAAAADPTSEVIAYDRARLALESDVTDPKDLEPLTTMTLHFEASRQLARDLNDVFAGSGPRKLTATASLGVEQDSNVTLLPDAELDHSAAARAVLDATLSYRPTQYLELSFIGQLGYHLDDRDDVALYDFGVMSALVVATGTFGSVSANADISGTVVTDSFLAETFSRDAIARLDLQLNDVPLHPGLYGRLGLRDFAAGNLEDAIYDRDTELFGAGIVSDWRSGKWSYLARAGVLAEPADGPQQRQRGVDASAIVRFRLQPLTFAGTLAATRRIYYDSTTDRRDTRFTPGLDVTWAMTETFGVVGGYTFTGNASTSDSYSYVRHLFRLALTGSF